MSRVSICMHHPCKFHAEEIVTYRWDYVYVTVSVQCHRVHEQNRQGCKVVLAKPLRSRDGKLVRCAVLQLVS